MRRVTTMLSAAAVVLVTAGLLAQAKPNFAGKWTRDMPAGAPAAAPGGGGGGGGRGGGGGGWGMECTITQDATTLNVEYMQGQNDVKLAYKLDGSESHNQMMGRGGAPADQVSKASWDGANLKIVTSGANGDTTMVVSMAGAKLSIATTRNGRDGTPATTTATYSKGM